MKLFKRNKRNTVETMNEIYLDDQYPVWLIGVQDVLFEFGMN